jgi:hypothetical protein
MILRTRNKDKYAELLKLKQEEASKFWTDPKYTKYKLVSPYIINSINVIEAREFKKDFLR